MNIFGVGLPEIAVISALALIIFGPKRLPELGRTIGKTLKSLQTASTEFEKEINNAMSDNESNEEAIAKELLNSQGPQKSVTKDDDSKNLIEG